MLIRPSLSDTTAFVAQAAGRPYSAQLHSATRVGVKRARQALVVAGLLAMIALGSGASGAAAAASSGKGDTGANEAITVESDRMQYDDRQRSNVFKGNVVLVRGDIEIRADELVLRQNDKGEQTAIATGAPATFTQRRGSDLAEGSGRELRFNGATREVQIVGNARLERLRAGQAPDAVSGARIVYQSTNDFFTVDGGKPDADGSKPKGRVRVVIQPRSALEGTADPTPPRTVLAPVTRLGAVARAGSAKTVRP